MYLKQTLLQLSTRKNDHSTINKREFWTDVTPIYEGFHRGKFSIESKFICHSSGINNLASRTAGLTIPKGSNIELTKLNKPVLVF